MQARIVAVCSKAEPDGSISKPQVDALTLRANWGIEGDLHAGRSKRQVLLMSRELLEAFGDEGMRVGPGDMGENLLVEGFDLMSLPAGTLLRLGDAACLRIGEQRTPCVELEDIAEGLLRASLGRCGRFAEVVEAGRVAPGDAVSVSLASPASVIP